MLKISVCLLLTFFLVGCQGKSEGGEKAALNVPPVSEEEAAPTEEKEPLPPLRTDVRITNLSFGSELDEYNNPKQRLVEFSPDSKLYAIVITDGNGPEAAIQVVVKDSNRTVVYDKIERLVPNGSWASAFNLRDGTSLASGEYQVEAFLEGHKILEDSFRIQ